MVGTHWSRAYTETWNDTFVRNTTGEGEAKYYLNLLMHPFFRLDMILDFDLSVLVESAHEPPPDDINEDFNDFIASHFGHQLISQLPLTLDENDDQYSGQLRIFDQRLDFFMQFPHGDMQKQAYADVCEATSNLLEIVINNRFSNNQCNSFCPSVLNGFFKASLRTHGSLTHEEIKELWRPLVEKIENLLSIDIPVECDPDSLNRFVYFVSALFGFLHLAYWWCDGASHNKINRFLALKNQIGGLRWRQLDVTTRFRFSVVALSCVHTLFGNEEPFKQGPGISGDSLLLLRQSLSDAKVSLNSGEGSMYAPMFRYFIGKIDEGLTYSGRLHRTELENFTETDQFEIQRLVEQFRHYRYAVTEEHLVGFLSQFDTPKRMQSVIRLLREVKFYSFGDLQVMIEEAFSLFEDSAEISTVVPLGNMGGSTALMSYLAAHGTLGQLDFQPDVERALENTDNGSSICFIEDASFSGTQLLDIFGDLLGTRICKTTNTKHCDPLSHPDRLLERPIRICLAIATDKALGRLNDDLKQMGFRDFQISACDIEVMQHRPFGPSMSYIWNTPDEQYEMRKIFFEVGKEILGELAELKDWPEGRKDKSALGFGSDERLIVYQYNVPKSTLTALWKRGMYQGSEWKPLFPADE